MTTEQKETRTIWETIEGSRPLYDLYGYYPTLHDASVINFDVRFESKQISLTFEYSDLIEIESEGENGNGNLETKIAMVWNDVSESNLRLYGNDIYDMCFHRLNGKIKTIFNQSFGIVGSIISSDIAVISVERSERQSQPEDNAYLHTVNFRLRA